MTTRTEEWVEARAQQMLSWLHPGHLHDGEQARILLGIARAIAYSGLPAYNRTIAIPDLIDPDRIPGRLLPLLGPLVGLDSAAGFPRFFGESEWRRWIPRAMQVWRQVGFDVRDILVAMIARPVLIAEWHARKDVLDETGYPLFGLASPGSPNWTEYVTDLHLPDPYGIHEDTGGTLATGERRINREMIYAALDALRGWNERFDITWYCFVDDFTQGLFQWARLSGAGASIASRQLTIPDGTDTYMAVGNATSTWKRVVWESLITCESGANYYFRLRHNTTAGTATVVRLRASSPSLAARLFVYNQTDASTLVELYSSGVIELDPGIRYHLQLSSVGGASADGVRVVLDGNELVTYAGATAQSRAGTCSVKADGGALTIDYTDVCTHPTATKRVGPQ